MYWGQFALASDGIRVKQANRSDEFWNGEKFPEIIRTEWPSLRSQHRNQCFRHLHHMGRVLRRMRLSNPKGCVQKMLLKLAVKYYCETGVVVERHVSLHESVHPQTLACCWASGYWLLKMSMKNQGHPQFVKRQKERDG